MRNQWLKAAIRTWGDCKDDLGQGVAYSFPAAQVNPPHVLMIPCPGLALNHSGMCKNWHWRAALGTWPVLALNGHSTETSVAITPFSPLFLCVSLFLSLSLHFFPLTVIFAIIQIFTFLPQILLIWNTLVGNVLAFMFIKLFCFNFGSLPC